jgi:hypothetical protein
MWRGLNYKHKLLGFNENVAKGFADYLNQNKINPGTVIIIKTDGEDVDAVGYFDPTETNEEPS